jgi:hypothetical protein
LGRHFDRFFGTLLSAVAAFLAVMPTTSKIQVQRSTTAGSARLSFFSLPTIPHDGFSQKKRKEMPHDAIDQSIELFYLVEN